MIALEIILGTLSFLSFTGFAFLTFIIRNFRSDEQPTTPPASLYQHPSLLPRSAYNPIGQTIWFWRNFCLAVFLADVIVIIFWQQILQ